MSQRTLSQKELKLKKEFEKCGIVEVPIETATMGTAKSLYMISNPALYRIKNTNSYLLYGEPMNYSNILEQLKESAKDPEKFKKMLEERMGKEEEEIDGDEVENLTQATEELSLQENMNVNEEDVKLIMDEIKITRDEAIKALEAADHDVIQALVNLNKK